MGVFVGAARCRSVSCLSWAVPVRAQHKQAITPLYQLGRVPQSGLAATARPCASPARHAYAVAVLTTRSGGRRPTPLVFSSAPAATPTPRLPSIHRGSNQAAAIPSRRPHPLQPTHAKCRGCTAGGAARGGKRRRRLTDSPHSPFPVPSHAKRGRTAGV
uniref:Uncharacterized protein n=1 Tax=Oryza punctata TaxID=4537 RepID=A0A0E0JGE3_ORYPU